MGFSEEQKLAFEEAWDSWIKQVLALLLLSLLVLVYLMEWVPEPALASVIALIALGIGFGLGISGGMRVATGLQRPVLIVCGIASVALLGCHLWWGLYPGSPAFEHVFEQEDTTVDLPPMMAGRIEVEALPLPSAQADGTEIRLLVQITKCTSLSHLPARLRLADKRPSISGERNRLRTPHLRKAFSVGKILDGATASIAKLEPEQKVRLKLRIYEIRIPLSWMVGFLILLALVTGAVEGRQPDKGPRLYLTVAICTGAALTYFSQGGFPEAQAVQALTGPLMLSIIPGVIGGTLLPWLFRKWYDRGNTSPENEEREQDDPT